MAATGVRERRIVGRGRRCDLAFQPWDGKCRLSGRPRGPRVAARRLDTHLRSLRVLLDANGIAIAEDTIDAAKRALDSAEPAAPMLMLKMARGNLAAVVRRQAARSDAFAARAA